MFRSEKSDATILAHELLAKICDIKWEELSNAFGSINSYKPIVISKRNGKKRQLFVPPNELLFVQHKLLRNFLYKFIRKSNTSNPLIDPKLMGFIPGKSHVQHSIEHTKLHSNFVLKLDLKDAFSSVKEKDIHDFLESNLLYEISLYKRAYYERIKFFEVKKAGIIVGTKIGQPPSDKEKLLEWRKEGKAILIELLPNYPKDELSAWDAVVSSREFKWQKYYPSFPLFSNKEFPEFRKLVREEDDDKYPNLSSKIIKELVKKMVSLMTYEGALPQGAPTSGFLFNLIFSRCRVLDRIKELLSHKNISFTFSVYADDLVIGFTKKPSKGLVKSITRLIKNSNIFIVNSEKTKLFDRASIAPAITGFRLIRRLAKQGEIEEDIKAFVAGAKKRKEKGGEWIVDRISLPKNVQKKIRGLIHYATMNEVADEIHSKINGYLGYVCQAYGNSFKNIPNQLSIPIQRYAQKYGKLKNFTD